MSRHVFPTSGLLRLFTSALPPMFPAASSWAGDLRRPSQHSASHLSDRCLPPKQWIITALHLSGCTHLVWSAAFFASVPCHGLAPAVCLPSNFFFLGMARRCFVSVWLYLFVSVSFLFSFSPTHAFFLFSPWSLSLSASSSPSRWPRHPNQMNKQIMWGEKERTKKEEKRMFYHRGNKGRSNLSSSLFGVLTECLPSPRCGIFPSPLFSISLVPIFTRLAAALFSLLKAWTPSVKKEKKRSKVMSFWKMRMTV